MKKISTHIGADAPKYIKHKIEGETVEKAMAIEDAAQIELKEINRQIEELEEKGQCIYLKAKTECRELLAAHLGKKEGDIVITMFDPDMKMIIVRDKTEAELAKEKAAAEHEAAQKKADEEAANENSKPAAQ